MIELIRDVTPSDSTIRKLKEFQDEIDALESFSAQSEKAKDMFPQKNTKTNKVFREIKECLTKMCNSTRRCVYCEDSIGDEVEHIYPKDLYPEKCFTWDNYVYACGPCNGPKNNKFAVFQNSDGSFVEVNPPRGTAASKPVEGEAALINPRVENPLDYAILDLSGTFKFYPKPNISAKDNTKVDYTYNKVLRLNNVEREPLRQARENAYGMYKARLFEYVTKKDRNATQEELDRLIEGIETENHPTVWKEMQRYYKDDLLSIVDEELKLLFDAAPDALNW